MIKILHIATNIFGGAQVVTYLNQNLNANGIESNILHLIPVSEEPAHCFCFNLRKPSFSERLAGKAGIPLSAGDRQKRKLKGKLESNYPFSFPQSDYDISSHPLVIESDILHFHWISGFLDFNLFSKVNKPMVWTLHDMHPFTGGCHHSQGCMGYQQDCGSCPQLRGAKSDDYARQNLAYKLKYMKKADFTIVSLNKFMQVSSRSSTLFGRFPQQVIPNSIDMDVFSPTSKKEARKRFEIAENKIVLGFSSSYFAKGKGGDLLAEALVELSKEHADVELVYIGRDYSEFKKIPSRFLGWIGDSSTLPFYYGALDAIVIPSREDNLPTVMLEAMACGRPIVSFKVGGLADHVIDGKTGYLANEISAEGLLEAMRKFVSSRNEFQESLIRQYALDHFFPGTPGTKV